MISGWGVRGCSWRGQLFIILQQKLAKKHEKALQTLVAAYNNCLKNSYTVTLVFPRSPSKFFMLKLRSDSQCMPCCLHYVIVTLSLVCNNGQVVSLVVCSLEAERVEMTFLDIRKLHFPSVYLVYPLKMRLI